MVCVPANYQFECVLAGEKKYTEDQKEHLVFKPLECTVDVGGATVRLEDLFGGDTTIGNATNAVINDNVGIFIDEVKPAILKSLTAIFTEISNKITSKFEYSELFPQ